MTTPSDQIDELRGTACKNQNARKLQTSSSPPAKAEIRIKNTCANGAADNSQAHQKTRPRARDCSVLRAENPPSQRVFLVEKPDGSVYNLDPRNKSDPPLACPVISMNGGRDNVLTCTNCLKGGGLPEEGKRVETTKQHDGSGGDESMAENRHRSPLGRGLENEPIEVSIGTGKDNRKIPMKYKCYFNSPLVALSLIPAVQQRVLMDESHLPLTAPFRECMKGLKLLLENPTRNDHDINIAKKAAERSRDLLAELMRQRDTNNASEFRIGAHAAADVWLDELLNMLEPYHDLYTWEGFSMLTCQSCGETKDVDVTGSHVIGCNIDCTDIFDSAHEVNEYKGECAKCKQKHFKKQYKMNALSPAPLIILTRATAVLEVRREKGLNASKSIAPMPRIIHSPANRRYALKTSLLHQGTVTSEYETGGHWVAFDHTTGRVYDDDKQSNAQEGHSIKALAHRNYVEAVGIYAWEQTSGDTRPTEAKKQSEDDTTTTTPSTNNKPEAKGQERSEDVQDQDLSVVSLPQMTASVNIDELAENIAKERYKPAEVAKLIEDLRVQHQEIPLTDRDRSYGLSISVRDVRKIWPPANHNANNKYSDVEYNLGLVKKAFSGCLDVHRGTHMGSDELRVHFKSLEELQKAYDMCVNMMTTRKWSTDIDLHYLRTHWKAGGLRAEEIPGRLHFGPLVATSEEEATQQAVGLLSSCLREEMTKFNLPLSCYVEMPITVRRWNKKENAYTAFAICRSKHIASTIVSQFDRKHAETPSMEMSGNGELECCYLCKERGHNAVQCKKQFIIRVERSDYIPVQLRLELQRKTGAYRSTTGNQQEHGPARSWGLLFYRDERSRMKAAATILKDRRVSLMICKSMPHCCEGCGQFSESNGTYQPPHARDSPLCPAAMRHREKASEHLDRNIRKLAESSLNLSTPSDDGLPDEAEQPQLGERQERKRKLRFPTRFKKAKAKVRSSKLYKQIAQRPSHPQPPKDNTPNPPSSPSNGEAQPSRTLSVELSTELTGIKLTEAMSDEGKPSGKDESVDTTNMKSQPTQTEQQPTRTPSKEGSTKPSEQANLIEVPEAYAWMKGEVPTDDDTDASDNEKPADTQTKPVSDDDVVMISDTTNPPNTTTTTTAQMQPNSGQIIHE